MSRKKKYIIVQIVLSLVVICGLVILLSGTELLIEPIIENGQFPLGNFISWIILAVFPAFFFQWFRRKSKKIQLQKLMVLIALILGVAWGIFSFILAGNWQFSFDNSSYFIVWMVYTAMIIFLPLIGTLIHGISVLKRK